MNMYQMDSTIIRTHRYLIQSSFSVVCIDLEAPQYRKPPKTKNQTHLLSPRSKNVNFDPPKGHLPLNFFQQNYIGTILGYC
jgi:hypothetical protein